MNASLKMFVALLLTMVSFASGTPTDVSKASHMAGNAGSLAELKAETLAYIENNPKEVSSGKTLTAGEAAKALQAFEEFDKLMSKKYNLKKKLAFQLATRMEDSSAPAERFQSNMPQLESGVRQQQIQGPKVSCCGWWLSLSHCWTVRTLCQF